MLLSYESNENTSKLLRRVDEKLTILFSLKVQ
jgi:hypothetical protein